MISRRERAMTYTLLALVSIGVLFPLVWVLLGSKALSTRRTVSHVVSAVGWSPTWEG